MKPMPVQQLWLCIPRPLRELVAFGIREARACVFAGSFFLLLFLSSHIPLFGIARYDFLFIATIAIQAVLYYSKIETWDEVKTIFLFHIVGLCLEIFKTSSAVGSWSYPEPGLLKITSIPLFSGFMYAAVGSYIAQAWRILDLFVFYWKTRVYFTTLPDMRRWMPLNTGFMLMAFFIWIAENISTFLGAWKYPNQVHVWNVVSFNKITSWFLLVIISFIIVSYLKHYKIAHNKSNKISLAV